MKDAVDSHRTNLRTLDQLISNISKADSVSLDADFEDKLNEVKEGVNKLTDEVKAATSGGLCLLLSQTVGKCGVGGSDVSIFVFQRTMVR